MNHNTPATGSVSASCQPEGTKTMDTRETTMTIFADAVARLEAAVTRLEAAVTRTEDTK